jgi:RNA polymerase sigma factor (sigma-70 family)
VTDEQLVIGCLQREPAAERRFFERFSGVAMAICRRYLPDHAKAQDIHQDGFVRCYQALKKFRGEGSLEGWVRRVFVSTCLDALRRNRKAKVFEQDLEEAADVSAPDDNSFLLESDAAYLMHAIASLPEGARVVFNLFAVEGYTHSDVASTLGITEGASRAHLTRARVLLKTRLAAYTSKTA